jgi:hypothetical protein
MTLEDYSRNVRGINDGESFSPEFVVRCNCVVFCVTRCLIEAPSKRYMTKSENVRLSCRKNIQVKWGSNTHGRNCWLVQNKLVGLR